MTTATLKSPTPPAPARIPTAALTFELAGTPGLIAIKARDKATGRELAIAFYDAEERASLIAALEACGDEADVERRKDIKTRRYG